MPLVTCNPISWSYTFVNPNISVYPVCQYASTRIRGLISNLNDKNNKKFPVSQYHISGVLVHKAAHFAKVEGGSFLYTTLPLLCIQGFIIQTQDLLVTNKQLYSSYQGLPSILASHFIHNVYVNDSIVIQEPKSARHHIVMNAV